MMLVLVRTDISFMTIWLFLLGDIIVSIIVYLTGSISPASINGQRSEYGRSLAHGVGATNLSDPDGLSQNKVGKGSLAKVSSKYVILIGTEK